ncbi:hypothetical protein BACCIP111883_01229 [Sutcliffiella rhizosphaerae]|uniref:Uncharacterized protein n=1 Tax=Sutcliffiella rhizosphaerae TaxID=2880967 RepID=A0ABM8YKI3_9BACI|nr:hypothetical protein BACCIP111883_01229 [Sutcliffiella rhizosphaerae]
MRNKKLRGLKRKTRMISLQNSAGNEIFPN